MPETLVILNAAIANKYFDFPTGRVEAHPNFRVIAAGNTFGTGADINYTGRYSLDKASLDRFAIVKIDYSPAIEESIADGDNELIQFCRAFREATDKAGVECLCSYRTMERIKKLSTVMGKLEDVIETSLTKGMDQDTKKTVETRLNEDPSMSTNKYAKAFKRMKGE